MARTFTYLAASLDIVAHELTHGVTESSSGLIYMNESGALNEAFSDIMGASVEFFYQPVGSGLGQAEYLIGEDSFAALWRRPQRHSIVREPARPTAIPITTASGSPAPGQRRRAHQLEHREPRVLPGHRGRHEPRVRLTVQGVGASNREQIEKVFYRAFVFLLPASATFATARAATIQAARDLYGTTGRGERGHAGLDRGRRELRR